MLDIKDEGIILEKTSLSFEAKGVLNPVCIKVGKTTHMFYRAISKDDISSIGYCQLINNRVVKRLNKPILFPEYDYEKKGIEDPRIVFIEDKYYMTYTAYDGKNAMIAYATSSDTFNFKKGGLLSPKITYEKADKIFKRIDIGKKYDYFKENVIPAAIASIQTFGDFLGFNPHLHILAADGCFGHSGMFYASGKNIDADKLELLFRHKVLSMLKRKRLITEATIELISSWRHSGFNVYCTERIYPGSATFMENLARYIIRASF